MKATQKLQCILMLVPCRHVLGPHVMTFFFLQGLKVRRLRNATLAEGHAILGQGRPTPALYCRLICRLLQTVEEFL